MQPGQELLSLSASPIWKISSAAWCVKHSHVKVTGDQLLCLYDLSQEGPDDPAGDAEIEALPGYVRAHARQLIRELKENPRPPRAKEL